MKYLITALIALLLAHSSKAQTFDLKNKKQQLEWTGKAAFKAYSLTGTLNVEKGTIKITDNTITKLEIVVNMKSLDHDNGDLKSHLRGADFFNVNRYKKAAFRLSKPVSLDKESSVLAGMMTIKEKTHGENIEVIISRSENTITLSFDHTMDRTTYGIKYNSPSFFKSLKQNAIADEFSLKGKLEFKKDN
ncbi:YceI family protein [Spongiivirga citrea]|uniref:YceI family protein n=1 Tax=Spongiivirga citrea TaxID=1481457 RepID=A0A6M0CJS4_9FLAO|nr:YceI family protein [Spongiivirga citrea]NER18186.1 YceI family protein [Spongiivirga citrea]